MLCSDQIGLALHGYTAYSGPYAPDKDPHYLQAVEQLPKNRRSVFQRPCWMQPSTAVFLLLVSAIFLMSLREWILLLARKKAADLRETPPTWLPDYALAQAKPLSGDGVAGAGVCVGQGTFRRSGYGSRAAAHTCACAQKSDVKIYNEVTEERFKGVRRCC